MAEVADDLDRLEDGEFRARLRNWLHANYPAEWRQDTRRPFRRLRGDDVVRWMRMLCDAGWRAPAWPREYGGLELSFRKQMIYREEMEAYAVARVVDQADIQLGPTIMIHGTEAQKVALLPPMLRGDHVWCQGYSEPGAGSDLAALKTSAVVDGDMLRITGQKIWTTHADESTHIFVLVRTSKGERKQQGISFVLAEMDTPGITVRPIANLAGETEFCEVFFDDARVPLANVVGGLDNGWTVAKSLLGYERVWAGSPVQVVRALDLAAKLVREPGVTPGMQDRYAECAADLHDLTALFKATCNKIAAGREPGPEVSMLKIISSELLQRITELNLEFGAGRAAIDGDAQVGEFVTDFGWQYFQARPVTIYAGANEVQRNLLAKTMLGLGIK